MRQNYARGGGRLDRLGAGVGGVHADVDEVALAAAALGAEWHGMFDALGEARLTSMRSNAERVLKKEVPDLCTWFRVELGAGARGLDVVNALNRLDVVEIAYLASLPAVAPVPPDYTPSQQYLGQPPIGIGVDQVRHLPGGTGAGVRFVDIEYQFNSSHLDLAPVARIGPPEIDLFPESDHGTAVLGQIVSLNKPAGPTTPKGGSARPIHLNGGSTLLRRCCSRHPH